MEVEQLLLDRAQAGDREAFARLSTLHREAVYRAAYWVLGDSDESLDATQEAFLKAYRHITRFEGRSSFRTWVRRIATNEALDRRARRQRRDRRRGSSESELADPRAEEAREELERSERRRLVREAIDSLPPAARAAVLLRDVEGHSYAEIAEQLGVPKGTVMSRLHHGRQLLKSSLATLVGPQAERLRIARAREET